MVRKAISIATILLVIFVVGIVYANASTRVSQPKAVGQDVYVANDAALGLFAAGKVEFVANSAMNRLHNVEDMTGQPFNVFALEVGVFDEGAGEHVGRAVFTRVGVDELEELRQDVAMPQVVNLHLRQVVAANDSHALPSVYGRTYNFYLNNRRNRADVMRHLNYSNLALRCVRVSVPRQLGNVLLGLCPSDLQKVLAFETASVLNDSPVDNFLATPVFNSFSVSRLKVLRYKQVFKADPSMRDDVDVNGNFVELNFAVA
jgi:hypothetical protein